MPGSERIELASVDVSAAATLTDRVRAARLVCFATDTVYGVGGALTPEVAGELVAAKGRDPAKPLQVVFPSWPALVDAVAMAPRLRAACRRLLPGPVTLLVPYPAGWRFPPPGEPAAIPDDPAGEPRPRPQTLGVRVPAWPATARVMARLGIPLVASSANPSGGPAPAEIRDVDARLLSRCDLVLDAGRVDGRASSVVDLSRYAENGRWWLIRAGAWSEEEVAARLSGVREAPRRP
jgi:L-threonylcarbamoyladenylate synthase